MPLRQAQARLPALQFPPMPEGTVVARADLEMAETPSLRTEN